MFNDLVGWILFGVVLGLLGGNSPSGAGSPPGAAENSLGAAGTSTAGTGSSLGALVASPGATAGSSALRTTILVVLFVVVTLTIGRWLIAKILRFIQTHTSGRGAVLGLIFTLTLAAAGFAEYAGIHAIFGAFIVAIAIGDALGVTPLKDIVIPIKNPVIPSEAGSRQRSGGVEEPAVSRGEAAAAWGAITTDIRQIVTNVFAPFFFASIGLRTNFAANFSLGVTLTLNAVACLGKILGASWGARLGGMDARSSWAVGLAMNARGAMEIILGVLALRAGLIGERMFVALVVMALFTSLISGPAIQAVMKDKVSSAVEVSGEAASS